MGAVVEDAVASGAEQPQGQFPCEGQGRDLQMLISDERIEGHSPCWGALRVILMTFSNPDTCMALQALPQGTALLQGSQKHRIN